MHHRVTVIIFCVCVCVSLSVYLLPRNLLPTSVLRRKQSFMGFFMMFSTFLPFGFPWKRFVQEFWCHLLVTATFLAPWRAFDGQKRQRWLLSTWKVYMVSYRSNTHDWFITDRSTLAEKLLGLSAHAVNCWHGIAHVILLDIAQLRAMCILVVTPLTLDIVLGSLGSMWASRSNVGHVVLLSACAPRVLHCSASLLL